MWLRFGEKHFGSWWIKLALMLLPMFGWVLRMPVEGSPQRNDTEHTTKKDLGWAVLIQTTTTTLRPDSRSPLTNRRDPGWGRLIVYPNGYEPKERFVPITEPPVLTEVALGVTRQPTRRPTETGTQWPPIALSDRNSDSQRPAALACREWISLDPGRVGTHILDGDPVELGLLPHIGALLVIDSNGDGYTIHCGSSLISERFVVTAAHCVNDRKYQPVVVRFGVIQWDGDDAEKTRVDAKIKNITIHPHFNESPTRHDIAIIELMTPINFTLAIKPACLYTNIGDMDLSITLIVSGWGVTNLTTQKTSNTLLMANVTTVPLEKCNEKLTTHLENAGFRNTGLIQGQYCAIDEEKNRDACYRDSGGPLQFIENFLSTIVGIVSFGQLCGTDNPGVYTRVANYLDWIENIVWPS